MIMIGLVAAVVSGTVAVLAIRLARHWKIVDDPGLAPDRKQHAGPVPLLGGAAIIIGSLATLWMLTAWSGGSAWHLPLKQLIGLSLAGLALLVGGTLDDRFNLSPRRQLIAPLIAVLAVVVCGIGIKEVANPFGGLIHLDSVNFPLLSIRGVTYHLTLWADLFTIIWLFITMYATKLLDGLDGLVTGVGAIGSVVVFLLTRRPEVNQPDIGALAIAFGGACVGFLIFNWHPARIFLGESGSLYIGFMLGILAIIAGGKLATALLILGLPILDMIFVILYRRFILHQSPWRTADRSHLHFRLLDRGWSVRQTVGFFYAVTIVFGVATPFVHGLTKMIMLGALAVMMIALAAGLLPTKAQSTKPL
jgi:UDP-GlcNAc:undecaprenyl-phosphate GlcNAc-1-phosphate transferase